MLAQTLNSLPMGIVCLQETKSLCTDHVRSLNWHFYLSGDASDPHAGVGFAVPQFLHPLVHDFIPVTSRIAILQLSTKPRPISLFSIYAPSQLADAQEDSVRKNIFGVLETPGTLNSRLTLTQSSWAISTPVCIPITLPALADILVQYFSLQVPKQTLKPT